VIPGNDFVRGLVLLLRRITVFVNMDQLNKPLAGHFRGNRHVDAPAGSIPLPISRLMSDAFVAQHCSDTRRVAKNKDVIIAGKYYEFLYVNHDGWLFRYKILHNGGRQVVDFVLPGEIFGVQACLFRHSLYSVATITEASLSAIPISRIDDLFERSSKLSKALFWSAACEAAILAERLIDAARRTAYERISHLLLELFIRLKRVGATHDLSFHMPLTQELIGDALGLTTVHVNRTLRALREDKLVSVEDKVVTILDFEALSFLCDFEKSYLGEDARVLRHELNASVTQRPSSLEASV
jgi:CRP-like cAMP-binding protein